mgnify:CR=1 FL=1
MLLEPGRSIGNVSACDRGGELWYSSLLPDRQDTLGNHLEMLVRASEAAGKGMVKDVLLQDVVQQ